MVTFLRMSGFMPRQHAPVEPLQDQWRRSTFHFAVSDIDRTATKQCQSELATDGKSDCRDVVNCPRSHVRWVYGHPAEERIPALLRKSFHMVLKTAVVIEKRQINLTRKTKCRLLPD